MIAIGIRTVTTASVPGGTLPSPAAMGVFAAELESALSLLRVDQPAATTAMPRAERGQDPAATVTAKQAETILAGLVPWVRQRAVGRRTEREKPLEHHRRPDREANHD